MVRTWGGALLIVLSAAMLFLIIKFTAHRECGEIELELLRLKASPAGAGGAK